MGTTIAKNQTASAGKYSYKYVDIAQIHEYLDTIGARYYQYIDRIDGDDYIMTVRIIDGKEMPPLRGVRLVDAKLVGIQNPAQEQGSALTYARRYSLLMAFGLATTDDDAQSLTRDRKCTQKQMEILGRYYQGQNMAKLLIANNITRLDDLPFDKASDLISKVTKKEDN